MKITFQPQNIVFESQAGENLLQTAERAGVWMDVSCGGKGTCGKCRVLISGAAGAATETERRQLTEAEIARGVRLACCVRPEADLEVTVERTEAAAQDAKKDMNFFPSDFHVEETVRKLSVTVPPATIRDQRSDEDRLLSELAPFGTDFRLEPACLYTLGERLLSGGGRVTVAEEGGRVFSVESGDTSDQCYGVAFDIGTTTVVGLLWNLKTGELAGTEARTNPQRDCGADVISRIYFASLSEENLRSIRDKIRGCLEELLEALCRGSQVDRETIYRATVVGNTAMSHLFLGIEAGQLARSPFAPVFTQAAELYAEEVSLGIHPRAGVRVLPNIAGHVGSDISAVLLASRLAEKEGVNLAVDIGTNGEILLGRDGSIMACSTAAGPAFEGAEISQGMRAAPGAIQRVEISERGVELSVIGGVKPVGLCGSGLIDAVAQLHRAGLLDDSGRFVGRKKAEEAGLPEAVTANLIEEESGKGFALYRGEGASVVLTQKDVRQVQLAKGAILAGIRIMLSEMGLEAGQIRAIYLAGAFGNFVRGESVLEISMLPEVEPRQIHPIGNAAGVGASMALLSDREYERVKRLAAETAHVELSAHPGFQNEFVQAMALAWKRSTGETACRF